MSIEKDMTGRRFGTWKVIEKSDKKSAKQQTYWVCGCDCGTVAVVRGDHLRLGASTGCKHCVYGRVD